MSAEDRILEALDLPKTRIHHSKEHFVQKFAGLHNLKESEEAFDPDDVVDVIRGALQHTKKHSPFLAVHLTVRRMHIVRRFLKQHFDLRKKQISKVAQHWKFVDEKDHRNVQARLSHLSNVQAEDRDSRTFPSSRNLSDCQRESIVNELYHSKYRKHQQTERPFIAHLLSAQQQYNVVRLTRGMHMLLPDQQRHFRRQQRILHFYCALVERRIQRFVFRPKVEELRLVSSKYWPHGLTITTEPPDEPPLSPSAPSLNLAVSVDGSAWDDLPPSPAGDPAAPPGKPHKRPAKSPKAHQAPPPGHWGVLNAPCLPSPKSPSAAGKLVPPCSKKHLVGLQGYAPPLLSPGCDAASPVPSPKAHRSPLRSPKHRGPAGAAPLPDRPPSPGGLHCGPGLGESVGHGKPEPAGRAPGHLESLHDRPVSPKSRRHPSRAEGHAGDRAHELSPVVGHKGAHAHAHSSAPPTPHNRAGGSPGRDCGSPRDSSVSPRHRRAHHGPHATHPADGRGAAAAAGPDPLPDSPRRRRRKDKGAAPHARNDPHRTSPARDDSPRTSPAREGSPRTSPAREGSPRTSPARDDSPRAARGPDSPHRRAKRTPSKVTKPPPLVEPLEGPAHAKSPRARSPSPAGHGAPAEDAARAASPTCPPTHKSSAGSPAHLESLGHSLSTGIGRRSSSRVLSPKGALAAAPLESVLHPHADVASPGKIRRSPCDRGRQRSATPTGVTDGAIHLTTPGDALCRRSPRARAPLADLPDAAAEPATDHSLPPGHHLRPPDPQSRPAPHGSGTHIPRLDPLAAPPGGDSLHPSAQCLQPSPRRSSALHLPLDPLACAQALLPSDAECPFLGGSLLHCGSVKGLRGAAGRVDLTALANPLGASLSNDSLDTQLSAAAATPTSSSGKALKALTPADLAGPGGICGGDREAGAAHGALTKSPSLRGSAEGRLHVAQGHLTHSSPHGGPRLNGLQSLSARDVPA